MPEAPTKVRHSILAATTLAAFLMYLDRVCLAWIVGSESFKESLHVTSDEMDWVKGAFFWAYALAQVPAGWLSDRFGGRVLMTVYIASWSVFTLATSFSVGFVTLFIARLGCGLAEAGAYPASSSFMTKWAQVESRGLASSIISMGGRIGGALAPWLTATVILSLGDWRWAGWLYGAFGILVAGVFWKVYREHPKLHPACNASEVALLAEGRGDFSPIKAPPRRFPWGPVLQSGNLWLMNGYQFLTNIGWAFLILSLPDYLTKAVGLSEKETGTISTLALTIGIASLPLGGMLTDYCTRKLGCRWGRRLPLATTRFLAAGAYLVALTLDSPIPLAIAFGAVAFFADLALPAAWACMQDISGRHQAQLFGWSNMWGNFGAAIQPKLFAFVLLTFDDNHDYQEGILLCAVAFVLAGILALGINAQKQVVAETNLEATVNA